MHTILAASRVCVGMLQMPSFFQCATHTATQQSGMTGPVVGGHGKFCGVVLAS